MKVVDIYLVKSSGDPVESVCLVEMEPDEKCGLH